MKKIFSILTLAVASLLTAQATQTITVTTTSASAKVGFRTNKISNTASTFKYGSGSYTYAFSQDWAGVTTETNYYVVERTMSGNTTLTISITSDDLTYFEITNGADKVSAVNVSGAAATLNSLVLKGCTNLTTLTLGTMSALADVNVANTRAAVANAITATNCPALQNLNVAGCGLSSLAYTGTTLYSLDISRNSFTTLDLSAQTNLDILRCESNSSLTTLKLPASVTTLSAQNSGLTSVTGYGENLQVFDVASNALTTLSVEEMVNATDLDVSGNHLTFRSFPSSENKPARMNYEGNDGEYPLTDNMRPAFGSYSYPLQSRLPGFSSRTDADFTIDLSDDLLDGNGNKRVSVGFVNGSGTALTQAVSEVDGNDYTIDTSNDLYGFMKAQAQVRAKFTNSTYPLLTLYSGYFTVPDGVNGTLKIVDEDGSTLYTKANAFFSDANDGLPDYAVRDYTKYTIPAMPTTEGETWTVTAGPSDDAPFAWAKSYGSAVWYYMSLGTGTNKWVTADERNGEGGAAYGGHALKSSYSTTNDYYQWAFVGNQYSGFKIYNKGCGDGQTLQDYSGYYTPRTGGFFPIMRSGTSLTWVVRTNSSGTGFSLENVYGGTDNVNGGVSAPCFLNDYNNLGYMNYWITSVNDAQNSAGSLINLTNASDPVSASIKWIIVDGSDNSVYTIVTDADRGTTVSSYPTELTTMAANRFVTLPTLTAFTVNATVVEKRISYTWAGPFQISTTGSEHHYKLYIRNALYITSNTRSDGALDCTSTDGSTNEYRWMFFGDPFNGFIIRNHAKGSQALAAANGTANGNFPTFAESGTRWIVTSCTQSGYTNPFSISPAENTGEYWNQFGGVSNNQGIKYWSSNGTSDGGSAIQAVALEDANTVTLTWNVVNADENVLFTVAKDYTLNSTVSEYPSEMTAYADYFVSYPALSSFTATTSRSIDVPYSLSGPFQLSTDSEKHLYRINNTYYSTLYAKKGIGERVYCNSSASNVSARTVWMFKGNPFEGIQVISYYDESTGLTGNTPGGNTTRSSSPTTYFIRQGNAADKILITDAFNSYNMLVSYPFDGNDSPKSVYLYAGSDNSQWNGQFTLTEVDESTIVLPGYYKLRNVAGVVNSVDLSTHYLAMNTSGGVLHTAADVTDIGYVAYRLDEQEDFSWLISHTIDGTPYYLDNTCTSYKDNTVTTTTNVANAQACTISYDSKSGDVPFFRIKAGTFASYDGYTYLNINSNGSGVFLWIYTSGTADGSAWALEPIELQGRTVDGTHYYTTAYLPFDYTLPDGVKAYSITVDGQEAVPSPLSGSVPAGTGVLLVGNGVSIRMAYSGYSLTDGDNTNIANNLMNGTYVDLAPGDAGYPSNFYVFSGRGSEVGFYRSSGSLAAYKAWLKPGATSVRSFKLVFGDDGEVTGIEMLSADGDDAGFSWENPATWAGAAIYDLQGRRVTQPQKGAIYIVNGRKLYYK